MAKGISVGLLGLGTVGSGVIQIIENHQSQLQHQVGCPVHVEKVVVRSMNKDRAVDIDESKLTTVVEEVIENPNIDVVVEVIGGVDKAKEYILTALKNKKHVVTANKDLMALHGTELLKVAAENGCDLFYEASVGGGIPLIRSLKEGLASDKITKMMGIVNGTTNFILTKMSKFGSSYEEVLKEAQELGYAESDPTADVEGLDAARKMVILATLGFSMHVDLDDVSVRGISKVTQDDLNYCKQLGYAMKLIGLAERKEGRIEVSVQPTLLPVEHPLASVNDEYNAVYVYGEAVGETMFYGPGAGSLPTATSIVSDLVTVMKNMGLGVTGKSIQAPFYEKQLKTDEEIEAKYFLRLHVQDRAGTFKAITSLFANENISFEKLLQLPLPGTDLSEIIIITHRTSKKAYDTLYQGLKELSVVQSVVSNYRVEGGE